MKYKGIKQLVLSITEYRCLQKRIYKITHYFSLSTMDYYSNINYLHSASINQILTIENNTNTILTINVCVTVITTNTN